jgi:RsiW-degrading membrane proteinase PrsW (M82 family)
VLQKSAENKKRKWKFFWIPFVLLFSIGIILYFIFRKELQIEEQLN